MGYKVGKYRGQKHWNFGRIAWNKGKSPSKEVKEKISSTLKIKYSQGLIKTSFQKGHPPYNSKLEEWRKNGGISWNKGLPSNLQPNWKGGITDINSQVRHLPQYIEWRTSIFERDDYTCRICGIKSGCGKTVLLQADHIKSLGIILFENGILNVPQAINCEELWDIKNGRTLCKDCHGKTDNYLWKGLIGSAKRRHKYLKAEIIER